MKKFIVLLPILAICFYFVATNDLRTIAGVLSEGPSSYSFYKSLRLTDKFCDELMAGEKKLPNIDTHEKCRKAFGPVVMGMIDRN